MIRQIENTQSDVVAFEAEGEITEPDFKDVVMPAVEKVVKEHDELNYLLLLNTELKNFSMQAWMQDALLGLKNITKWRRVAIVTDNQYIRKFTDGFSYFVPGEFKGFDKANLPEALTWVGAH